MATEYKLPIEICYTDAPGDECWTARIKGYRIQAKSLDRCVRELGLMLECLASEDGAIKKLLEPIDTPVSTL